jgi:hypothetical protein
LQGYLVHSPAGSADGNVLENNVAVATSRGFELVGDDGEYTGNVAVDTSADGFYVEGNHNRLRRNKAHAGRSFGFWVAGGDNRLAGNVASHNVLDSSSNHVVDSAAQFNGGAGYLARQ